MTNALNLLAVNLTKRCNLACDHCYLDATTLAQGTENELGTDEVCRLFDDLAKRSTETMIVLTGGEPLLRPDLEGIIMHGSHLGFAMVVGTNGTALTERRVKSLKAAGLLGVGISVDSLNPASHDDFRGKEGCWQKTMDGIELCRKHNLAFQIHFSVNKNNLHELDDIIAFAIDKGAMVLNVFFLICTGRGESMTDISPDQYDTALAHLINAQKNTDKIIIRPRCAPHYKRIAHQLNPVSDMAKVSGYDGDGCIAGIHYCRITDDGTFTACPYIETGLGNIREDSFWDIWDKNPDLLSLRKPKLQGKCGACEYQKLCGGCRARPVAAGRSLMAEDNWCGYSPQDGGVIEPFHKASPTVTWSPEASQRLSHIPGFIRKLVRKRAEAYVEELGENIIRADHLSKLAEKRFGGKRFKRPFFGRKASGE